MELVAIVDGLEILVVIIVWGFMFLFTIFLILSIRSLIRNQKDIISNQKLELEILQKLLEQKNNS